MKNKINIILTILLLTLVTAGVFLNVKQQLAIDESKLPEKLENNNLFQRWITNIKNNDINVSADDFRLKEENEIYNTRWMTIYSIDEDGMSEFFENTLLEHQNLKKVVFSPSGGEFLDYRQVKREEYEPNMVRFFGQKEDKIIDSRVVDCSVHGNCYFDRAYFLDNDVFVISEFSRNINRHDETTPICPINEECTYTIKIHLVDLIQNKRLVYESETFEIILSELIPEL